MGGVFDPRRRPAAMSLVPWGVRLLACALALALVTPAPAHGQPFRPHPGGMAMHARPMMPRSPVMHPQAMMHQAMMHQTMMPQQLQMQSVSAKVTPMRTRQTPRAVSSTTPTARARVHPHLSQRRTNAARLSGVRRNLHHRLPWDPYGFAGAGYGDGWPGYGAGGYGGGSYGGDSGGGFGGGYGGDPFGGGYGSGYGGGSDFASGGYGYGGGGYNVAFNPYGPGGYEADSYASDRGAVDRGAAEQSRAAPAVARVELILPYLGTDVWLNGQKQANVGKRETYVSPPLAAGDT
jgi:hypothetical protein